MSKRTFEVGYICDIGMKRSVNQDNILLRIGELDGNEFGLFAVADGMGGLSDGETASRIAIEELDCWWENGLNKLIRENHTQDRKYIDNQLEKVFLNINSKILGHSANSGQKVGTTLSVLLIIDEFYLIKHIGDSRVYSLGTSKEKLTEDHSWVADEVRMGRMTESEALRHPRRNVLTRCLGVHNEISTHSINRELEPFDIFLLSSDGFYVYFEEEDVYKIYEKNIGQLSCQELADEMLERINSLGAEDNVSMILVKMMMKNKGIHNLLNRFRRLK